MHLKSSDSYSLIDLATGRIYPPVASVNAALDQQRAEQLQSWEIWNRNPLIGRHRFFTI